MERRPFLQFLLLGVGTAVLPWQLPPGWRVEGHATTPGARLRVTLGRDLPHGAQLLMEMTHLRHNQPSLRSQHQQQNVQAGQELELLTPYPYAQLVAGQYQVELVLLDADSRELQRHDAGIYHIHKFRFSA